MIGVLIFTHGKLCEILRDEAERLTGDRDLVRCLAMRDGETMEELIQRADDSVEELDRGEGVLVLVDVVGGTPWNVAGILQRREGYTIRRVGGGGMPIVIKALTDHGEHHDLDTWAESLALYASTHVTAG